MKKALVGPCTGRFHRACALILCVMLASCTSAIREQKRQENISLWKAAGSPAVVNCSYPFEINTPAPSGSMEPQAHTSMRDFLPAAAAAQAPIQECAVIGGSDNASQIAKAGWGSLGYTPLHVWRPATATVRWQYESTVLLHPPPGQRGNFGDDYTYETWTYPERITAAYGAWYLGYQRNPQDNEQAKRQGAGLYAMQGFRCAIHMRDFPAARRYWALALSSNPGSITAYAQLALQSLFQVYFGNGKNDSGPSYLSLPQDIRDAVWDAASQRYFARDGSFTMARVEEAAQAGTLDKILSTYVPHLSVLYCPAFYPNFDPIPVTRDYDLTLRFPAYMLNSATKRAAGESGKGQ